MSTPQPDPTPPKAGGLWARLFGMNAPAKAESTAQASAAQVAAPSNTNDHVEAAFRDLADDVPTVPTQEQGESPASPGHTALAEEEQPPAAALPPQPCPACGTLRKDMQTYCDDCGWLFSNEPAPATPHPGAVAASDTGHRTPDAGQSMIDRPRLRDRYEFVEALGERGGVARFLGLDHSLTPPAKVVIVQGDAPVPLDTVLPVDLEIAPVDEEEIVPTFEDTLPTAQIADNVSSPWPSVSWEHALLSKLSHPGLPTVVESFIDGSSEYLIEEVPEGQLLWDAWDDPAGDAHARYGWLKQIAETLSALHQAGVICESLRPDIITVNGQGQAVLTDLGELLPLPVPPGTQIRGSLYTAPELVLSPESADSRADLYGFGAMLYALEYLHHGLEEKDFERQFSPKLITDRYPDVHPGFFRLISKTFNRDLNTRFPTDEAIKEDATGFAELLRTLDVCQRTFDSVRLDIAAWTTTGMVRTGNEDAFSFLHGMESRQDELTEYAMLLLCDGMGGYEAGEVAAALCLQAMRKYLLAQPIFSALAGGETPHPDDFTIDVAKKTLLAALKYANKEVHTAARTPGKGKRGMGCTAECVYVDNRHLVVGHVGDSRTYHLHQGRLIQLTRDQTLVNRLVELGQLTPEEAEDHPRKNELQQAIGGQPDVDPGLYHGLLKRGDWVLVCSDGLTNHIPAVDLTMMLAREAMSAEDAARRLMNLVNLRGATDNATIVVIRAS
ncbi:MAG TPA: protein phosphatase 2C domain-containing protein [Gemmataceae bacterium]|nr:protein phosphatase 2C domain-containing protein [Gemmataceae bacterium]